MTTLDTLLQIPVATLPEPVLPGATVTLALTDAELRRAIEVADGERIAFRFVQSELAVVGRSPKMGKLPGGGRAAIVQIESRARIVDVQRGDHGVDVADLEPLADGSATVRVDGLMRELDVVVEMIAELLDAPRLPEIMKSDLAPGALLDTLASFWSDLGVDRRAALLDAADVADRVELMLGYAKEFLAQLEVNRAIRNDVTEGMNKQQREFVLRQQLAAIRKELGEGDDDIVAEYRERLDQLDAAENVKLAISKELERLERMTAQSPEHSWIRTWLDRMFEMPWGERSAEQLDLAAAADQLDADHYGLDDVKDQINEFLATRKLRHERGVTSDDGRGHGTIMTLVGPPGVGKTSLGTSVATAMGRQFVRIALGGIRDEAEIRGHRRTYVGAQPGRLVRALTEAGTMNPVILLDEVDKLTAGGFSGDPTAALLEVLDPAQNHTFRDHYLEVDLDLSDVVFIATANLIETIPAALLDRMDVIRLDGYTEAEKRSIASRYLLPRQIERSGLRDDEVGITDEVIAAVISGYTREAGVRGLERELGKLTRKVAAQVAGGAETPIDIEPDRLADWLGRVKVDDSIPERTQRPGVATGLAVTGVGGDVLLIETTGFPTADGAEPGLTLTGQLGDVMKESAQIALNYVRSHADELGIDGDRLNQRFHVHVPAGAIPKDGPSAGITMTTALVSLLTERPVRDAVGMTGEITLQGAVLPIGGVKQKVLAAHRNGLREVVLPKRNEADIDDVPAEVRDEMTFHIADTYDDVLTAAFA